MKVSEFQEVVWEFRHEYSHLWPTPTPLDAARFAMMEACEALDAYVRLVHPRYSRNNQKELSIQDELADTIMMLVSITERPINEPVIVQGGVNIDEIVASVAHVYTCSGYSLGTSIANSIGLICSFDGMRDPLELVASRLNRIKSRITGA